MISTVNFTRNYKLFITYQFCEFLLKSSCMREFFEWCTLLKKNIVYECNPHIHTHSYTYIYIYIVFNKKIHNCTSKEMEEPEVFY